VGEPEPEPSATLVGELQAMLARVPTDLEALAARLRAELPFGPALRIVLPTHEPAAFHVPAPANAFLRMVPEGELVRIELDPALAATDVAFALAHAAAHLRLGHLRPGDPFGHWDTRESITSATPSRRWDRETRALLPAWASPTAPKRASLEECTPREKAWLVLLDHIGRMVGETHTLDPAAQRYQPAAYQRQAAQRLVAQLDEHGGAMLCDGVGLGKTYVATTVLVHYANTWQQRLAAAGRSTADDPLRVTILAPNSVVSTWQREALPSLAAHGVSLATVRVLSHTKLSRIVRTSEILERKGQRLSDMEHLLLSDLVIVDEAHNFRSVAARRTVVLRDLLRLQPRGDQRRKVLLLTATPVNNSLEDLRQQAALLFCKPLRYTDVLAPDKYREAVFSTIKARLAAARDEKTSDRVAALLIHGNPDAKFSYALDFRDDLKFGVQVSLLGVYLKEQEKRLGVQQAATRAAMLAKQSLPPQTARIAGDLLDRIVVQRSRALCKQIEGEQGSEVRLLFRPDAPPPEKLVYEDVYDDTRDVLARFLPLFETGEDAEACLLPPLSLKVYMWADVRDKEREATELSSVVGLQRVLVLKRLESSPVAFLITLLRLLALHAHRLRQLSDLCHVLGDRSRGRELDAELEARLAGLPRRDQEHLQLLLTGTTAELRGRPLLTSWSEAHKGARAAAGDDEQPSQLDLYAASDESTATQREQLDRLWGLKDDLLRDFGTLLDTAPSLADLIFGRFDDADWPRNFIVGGEQVLWPRSATWGLRVVTDAKLCRLVARLLSARADGQKVIVFSQFTDTLAYLNSVLQATAGFERKDWTLALRSLTEQTGHPVKPEDMRTLVASCALVSGETEDRDSIIHSFAPFYRLGPRCPTLEGAAPNERAELAVLASAWREDWTRALQQPVDVLLATDVLAEGVNLQDAAQLINYDVHWNPVRMIQRSGRIDRRLKPDIEDATTFPDLEALAAELRVPAPRYWWHDHPGAATTTVNLLLPDELEEELQLRERIANKTLAIDFTLGLEQGTGAEADWMAEYRYQGISALNAWQGDRAIERVAGYQERLRRMLAERTIDPAWIAKWNGWLREEGAGDDAPLLAWARLGVKGKPLTCEYSRVLRPLRNDGKLHWLWSTARPEPNVLNQWLVLDQQLPAPVRQDLGWYDEASRPLTPELLLLGAMRIVDGGLDFVQLLATEGRLVQQGASAISAGHLGTPEERANIKIAGYRLLQLATLGAPIPGIPAPAPEPIP
jgi:superfamily II DNA or RNA helicase